LFLTGLLGCEDDVVPRQGIARAQSVFAGDRKLERVVACCSEIEIAKVECAERF
jgi:hypothetical protein